MLQERRAFNRHDIYATVECKPLNDWSIPFFGITRNVSCKGLSFESQFYDLHPGEHVEFKIRYPKNNLIISTLGEIVWKKKSDKFESMTGIKFHDISKDTEHKILELLSAESNVPVDEIIFSEGEKNRQESRDEQYLQEELITRQTEEEDSVLEPPSVSEFPGERDILKNEQESVILSDDLFHISKVGDKEISETTSHEERYAFETKTSQEKGLWLHTVQTTEEHLTTVQEEKRGMNLMSVVVKTVFVILLALAIYVIIESFNSQNTEFQLSDTEPDSSTVQPGAMNNNAQENMDALEKPLILEESLTGQKEITQAPEREKRGFLHKQSTAISSRGTHEYFLQVGSWKHAHYAKITLEEIQKYYPEAYIIVENNFSKLRIPGIMSKKQGAMISKEIERKFKVKPLLLLEK